jgi:hypothetical protein
VAAVVVVVVVAVVVVVVVAVVVEAQAPQVTGHRVSIYTPNVGCAQPPKLAAIAHVLICGAPLAAVNSASAVLLSKHASAETR